MVTYANLEFTRVNKNQITREGSWRTGEVTHSRAQGQEPSCVLRQFLYLGATSGRSREG